MSGPLIALAVSALLALVEPTARLLNHYWGNQ